MNKKSDNKVLGGKNLIPNLFLYYVEWCPHSKLYYLNGKLENDKELNNIHIEKNKL